MKVREIVDKEAGRKWEIFKKAEDEYFYKYYEFFAACGWRFICQDGGHKQGYYYSKKSIEYEFAVVLP